MKLLFLVGFDVRLMMDDIVKFKKTIGKFATGVTIVTGSCEELHFGVTINSVTSVSLEPLMVLFCLHNDSKYLDKFNESRKFAINILQKQHSELMWEFTSKNANIDERFSISDKLGLPILKDSLATIECEISSIYSGGDHKIIVGQVINYIYSDGNPMIYYDGKIL